ncbi:MAG: hypothetical protein PWQ37_1203 [Candidatus Petromonas sp.]|jgi:RNA polymerase sporulation-specific sigma factor|nr:hypothetical protein [Candidatus Petromonas sp.]
MTIRAGKKIKNEVSIQEPIGIDKEGNESSLTVYLFTSFHTILCVSFDSRQFAI